MELTQTWFLIVCGAAVIGCTLVAGVFLSFSDFVMKSLDGARTEAGVEVMQIVNREVFRSIFIVLIWVMLVLSVAMSGYASVYLGAPTSVWVMIGGAFNVAGVLVVTFVFNVPMNEHLDTMTYSGDEAATYWKSIYMPRWTFWNHIRVIASTGSAACYLVACMLLVQKMAVGG